MDTSSSRRAPDAALLEYLGRYGDAAIGLDPIGLAAADDEPDAAASAGKEPR